MSNVTSIINEDQIIRSQISPTSSISSSVFRLSGKLLSELSDVDLDNAVSGSFLIYDDDNDKFVAHNITGDISIDSSGLATVDLESISLNDVDNTSDINKPISVATQAALDTKVNVVVGKQLSDENFTNNEKTKLGGIASGAEVNVNADWNASTGDAQILNKPTLGSAAAAAAEDFATAAQGALADTSLQPTNVDYRGEYNNGDGTYTYGSVVLWNGLLYVKISNPGNPGYSPAGDDWELFEPEIGSPAYDLWIQTTLANKLYVDTAIANNTPTITVVDSVSAIPSPPVDNTLYLVRA